MPVSGETIEFHMSADEFLDERDTFSCQKCTEDSTNTDSIEAMQDHKGQNNGCCQTAEIKSGFDLFVILFQDLRQVAWENISWDNRQHAVVREADTEAYEQKSGSKIQNIQWQSARQHLKPCIVYIDHFSEAKSDHEGKQCIL